MKIGIITLYGHTNYGNKLQNYALQQVLKQEGIESETIEILFTKSLSSKIKLLIIKFLSLILIKTKYRKKKRYATVLRLKKFIKFSNEYINVSKFKIIDYKIPKQLDKNYNFFITGSDQVWNPELDNKELDIYFLNFTSKEKRVSYAPSFGSSYIPREKQNYYKRNLEQMNMLSVREVAGQEIIRDLIDTNVPVLIDPTLMLSKEEWLKIAKKPKWLKGEKFILTYFLGEKSTYIEERIEQIAKTKSLKIINLLDFKNYQAYCSDPSEFLSLINNAELFCTDSFHGVVFSTIMETPFIVFERSDHHISMNSRLETILDKFNFNDRWEYNVLDENIFSVDFSKSKAIIDSEKQKALNFLSQALNLRNK